MGKRVAHHNGETAYAIVGHVVRVAWQVCQTEEAPVGGLGKRSANEKVQKDRNQQGYMGHVKNSYLYPLNNENPQKSFFFLIEEYHHGVKCTTVKCIV